MSRFTHCATMSGCDVIAVRAILPTTTSDSLKKTTLGVINSPSALGIIALRPASSTQAMAELVVPRSIPIGLSWGMGRRGDGIAAAVEEMQLLPI